ncbi:MAG: helix-turn-helix transcriptional regulator [Caulobacterales bacterium]|nr:helix-turn-helix transcriptional regulator [Caulobacterales bacterium]MCA0371727.1 helix-turn-helix transcriptional regulator [Pseudomonadota bacterium]
MPIKVNLDRILVYRKISMTELAQKIGITLANLSILKTGKARAIRFSTLSKICKILECQPADILEWFDGEEVDDND